MSSFQFLINNHLSVPSWFGYQFRRSKSWNYLYLVEIILMHFCVKLYWNIWQEIFTSWRDFTWLERQSDLHIWIRAKDFPKREPILGQNSHLSQWIPLFYSSLYKILIIIIIITESIGIFIITFVRINIDNFSETQLCVKHERKILDSLLTAFLV